MSFAIKENDTKPILSAVLQYADGTAIDLATATVYFVMRDRHGTVKMVGDVTVITPADGEIEYSWQKGDTDADGFYDAEFMIVYANGDVQTVPSDSYLAVRVLPQLAKFLVQALPASLAAAFLTPAVSVGS